MLTYELDRGSEESLYSQLYMLVRSDIENGKIRAGERLPSKRALAEHLGISVITVEGAYDQLVAEGYAASKPRCGYFACETNAAPRPITRPSSRTMEDLPPTPPESDDLVADLTGKAPAAGLFPYKAWARTMRSALSSESEKTLLHRENTQGLLELRRAISDYLFGFRGMSVRPEQIVIGAGAQSLYGLIVQLLGRDKVFAIENPGYTRLAQIYRANDVEIALVGLDSRGPMLADLESSHADVFHCMPSHQFPTGITTAVGRRRELLEWASGDSGASSAGGTSNTSSTSRQSAPKSKPKQHSPKRYIIEDDFDVEFRMKGRPIPPLQAMDHAQSVIYANTFTKTLGAAFRIGYMVLPPDLMETFSERLGFYACAVGALEQLTLARFISSGQYERHVRRQRIHFRKIQEELVKEMAARLDDEHASFLNAGSGLHFVLEVECGEEIEEFETEVSQVALESGVTISPLGKFCFGDAPRKKAAFVVNYASLEKDIIPKTAEIISNAISSVASQ